MAAQEKKGILRLMAEVVWRPKHDEKRGNEAEERNQSTIRPEFMIQRRVSTESLPRIPRTLKDIIEDPQHMADFEAYLKELDIDIDKDMCGFLDCFHFFVRTCVDVTKFAGRVPKHSKLFHPRLAPHTTKCLTEG